MNEVLENKRKGPTSRRRLLPVLAFLALGVVGMGTNSAIAAGPAFPISGNVSGTLSETGIHTFTLAGKGGSSVVGKISYQGAGVLTSPSTDTLTETLTAANGDTLTILCQQVLEPLGDGVLHGTDTWTVIGGTGRFSDASGSGVGDTYVHNLRTFTKHITGTITLRGN